MKYKIVVDSAGDLLKDHIKDEEVGFSIVPLTIRVGEKEFVDDGNLNLDELLTEVKNFPGKSSSACPSPNDFFEEFTGEEYTVCVTITSKLSGTYNSASIAMRMAEEKGRKVILIDSKGTSGSIELIADEAYRLMKAGTSYEDAKLALKNFSSERKLLFVLQSFDNLIKNGRMKRLTAIIAGILNIKPLCMADEGEIKIKEKIRNAHKSMNRLTEVLGEFTDNKTEDLTCIVTHCCAPEEGEYVYNILKEKYKFKKLVIHPMRGLSGFYAERKGVIVCF